MNGRSLIGIYQLLLPLLYGLVQVALFWLRGELLWVSVALLVAGMYIGLLLLYLDQKYLYKYYNDTAENSLGLGGLAGLVTRSVVFMLSLIPLSMFIISSTGSKLGTGVLLGVMGGLVVEMWATYTNNDYFHQVFLFQLKRKLSDVEIERVVQFALLVLMIVTALIFR